MTNYPHLFQLLLFLFFLPVATGAQTTYYLHPAGSDTNDGLSKSKKHAWQNLAYAVDQLKGGDILELAPGKYVLDRVVKLTGKEGTAEHPTIIRAAKEWKAELIMNNKKGALWVVDSKHALIEGLRVYHTTPEDKDRNMTTGLQAWDSDHVTFRRNYVSDCGCNGISFREGDYFTAEENVSRDNAKNSVWNCSGISVYQPEQLDDKPGDHIVLRGNVTFENECDIPFNVGQHKHDTPTDGNGIILDDFKNSQREGYAPFAADALVENNLSFNNGGAGIKAYATTGATFRGNKAFGNLRVLRKYDKVPGEISVAWSNGKYVVEDNLGAVSYAGQANALEFVGNEKNYALTAANNRWLGPLEIKVAKATVDRSGEEESTQTLSAVPEWGKVKSYDKLVRSVNKWLDGELGR